jgi:glycosyltransferase involved in cell wall biosynthesis
MHERVQLNTNTEWGGGEYQVLNLLDGLQRRGVPVRLLAHPDGVLLRRAQGKGLNAEALPEGCSRCALRRILDACGATLLHAHDSGALSLAAGVRRNCGIPVVVSRRVASPLRRNLWSRWKCGRHNVTAFLAISETVKRVLVRSGVDPDRIEVVPSGVDVPALDAVTADPLLKQAHGNRPLVCGIGKLSRKKNWEQWVRVAGCLSRRGRDLHWLLAGDGPEQAALSALAREEGVESRIHFLGFRSDADRILKSCDALLFPSLMEGASVTVRQAMVLGTPVVAVDAEGTAESLAGYGWLIRPGDVEAGARALEEILDRPDTARQKTQLAREHARSHYSLDATVGGTLRAYERLLAGPGAVRV